MQKVLRLRRFLDAPTKTQRQEICEFCGEPLGPGHSHVIDLQNRRLMCACRGCYLLFLHPGAAGGKYRSVGERYLHLSQATLNDALWDQLETPVGIVFFLRNSALNRVLAFYPSPAGATESGLPMDAWDEIVLANPELATIEPDIEALLVYRRRGLADCWIVPADACYELIGRIRRHWKGFDGGEEAWTEINAFFSGLKEREQADTAHV